MSLTISLLGWAEEVRRSALDLVAEERVDDHAAMVDTMTRGGGVLDVDALRGQDRRVGP